MALNFGIGLPADRPLTARTAVWRGHCFITAPVFLIMFGLWALALRLLRLAPKGPGPSVIGVVAIAAALVIGPPALAWVWWAYATPRWRRWALGQGVDPGELQARAQAQNLVWPKGHVFEKTEFRSRGPAGSGPRDERPR